MSFFRIAFLPSGVKLTSRPLDAVLDPGALLRVGNMHVLEADMTGISVLEDAEHLPERAEFQPERAADIDRAVVVGLGEAVGLGLELGMLAAGDEFERVEIGGEMAAGPVGADQHARAERVARRGQRLLLAQAALRRGRQRRCRAVLPAPRRAHALRRARLPCCRPRLAKKARHSGSSEAGSCS